MSENGGRFCVQFSGNELHSTRKTRILFKESTPKDIRDIWTQIYNSEPPEDIQLTIRNHSTYDLNDEDDFAVVMAIAEDQYRAHPSDPLHITLSGPNREYKPNTPPSSNPSPEQPQNSSGESVKDIQEDHTCSERGSTNESNLQSDFEEDFVQKQENNSKVDEAAIVYDLSVKKKQSGSPPSAQFPSSYNPQNGIATSYDLQRKFLNNCANTQAPNSLPCGTPFPLTPNSTQQPNSSFNHEKALVPMHSSSHSLPVVSPVSVASALMNNVQHQRLLQTNPNAAPFVLQSLRNSYERFAAINWLKQFSHSSLNNKNNTVPENPMDFKYFSDQESFTGAHAFHKNKRKSSVIELDGRKDRGAGKRMRSSSSQSNIEFHCEQATKYMNLPASLKKEHNSAHRSHWKHLNHVQSIWPKFADIYKHKKYDEWSSEARDIYAITLPEEYKWSFLTLAKQGDQLCMRIKARVEEMRRLPVEQRPVWCPSDETLNITWAKADERLQQLQRIKDARHTIPSSSKGSSKPLHQLPGADRFGFSSPQNQFVNQASAIQRSMFNDSTFNLMEQQALLSGRYKPMHSPPTFQSPVRPLSLPTEPSSFSGDMSNVSSPSEQSFKLRGTEIASNSADHSGFFYQRMKMFAANFHDQTGSQISEADDGSGFIRTKPVQNQPNSTPVSPTSPRRIA